MWSATSGGTGGIGEPTGANAPRFDQNATYTVNMDLAPKYMAENYMQHNPTVATGRQPFMDFFGRLERQPVKPTIDNLVTIMAERDLVVLAFRRELPDPKNPGQRYTTTWFDMLRIENGKIAEHWDYGTKSP